MMIHDRDPSDSPSPDETRIEKLLALYRAGKVRFVVDPGRYRCTIIDDPPGPPLTEEASRLIKDWYDKVIGEGRLMSSPLYAQTARECPGSGARVLPLRTGWPCLVCGKTVATVDGRVAPHLPRKAE